MKRKFPYITVGQILDELEEEGLPITRVTFYRLEERLDLPKGSKTSGKLKWRVYSPEQKEQVKHLIKEEYNMLDSNENNNPPAHAHS